MRQIIFMAIFMVFFAQGAQAQDIVQDPICFTIRNTADFTMFGNIATDFYTVPDGTQSRHRSNFRLDKAGSKDAEGYDSDRAEFCSYGPFFEDRKLEVVLRTLFPVFSCKTKIDQGEIIVKAKRKADDSGVDIWAECFE